MQYQELLKEVSEKAFLNGLIERLLWRGYGHAALALWRGSISSDAPFVRLAVSDSDLPVLKVVANLIREFAAEHCAPVVILETERRRFPIAQPWRKRSMSQAVEPTIVTPALQLAQCRLDENLIRVLMEFLENPDQKCGLVAARTEQQIALSESAAQIILGQDFSSMAPDVIRLKLVEATAMKREDYFWLPDLEQFRKDILALEPNNRDSKIVLRPRMQARDGHWYEYAHEYKAIQDIWGNLYHVGRSVGMEPVPSPV